MTTAVGSAERDGSLDIAVIGSGIAGLSAAWLLQARHRITLYEADERLGGHSHTVEVAAPDGPLPVDTGFIVYNEVTYPNLTALFRHLGVPTRASDMSFAVSLNDGALEYSGCGLGGLFAQRRNLVSPRFWSMLRDLLRFYRSASRDSDRVDLLSLGDYLDRGGYGAAFRDDHLYPMAAAIWSAAPAEIRDYPAAAFIRFCDNHGLLQLRDRPVWRSVVGGSRSYVERLSHDFRDRIRRGLAVRRLRRDERGVLLEDGQGRLHRYDQVVVATHADQALRLLGDADPLERKLLGAFRYRRNTALLHDDAALMPRRRAAWASWNYLARRGNEGLDGLCVTYWMNRLQGLPDDCPLFVTLNPAREPSPDRIIQRQVYEHPLFDAAAVAAQRSLWSLQGRRRTWFCGAYFGAGFHEDGLQAGLAVAEALGAPRRPWRVANESGRITLGPPAPVAEAVS